MATASCSFQVGSTVLLPYHVQVEQRSDWHHQFEVMVSTEKAKVMGGAKASESVIIDNAIAYVGETAQIEITRSSGALRFEGIVTNVRMEQVYAGDAFIVFAGYSPTFLMDGQRATTSFEEMSLKDIVGKIAAAMPANISQSVDPQFTQTIPYVVQYQETGYDFLNRLAAQYGEWFFFDGEQLVFGKVPDGKGVELQFGSDSMLSFNYGIEVRPTKTTRKYYKYQENETYDKSVASFQPGWLDPHSKTALKVSEELFTKDEVHMVPFEVDSQSALQSRAESEKSSLLSDVMQFNGQSAHPGVIIGAKIKVKSTKGFIGEYRVISVSHTVDSHNDYYNSFEAILATSTAPPQNKGVIRPQAESQVAEVVENNDPDKMGRVRVKSKWQDGMTPWVRVLTSDAGGEHGHYFTPEIGDEVLIDFEEGNPDRPYVVGSKYHGKIPPEFFNKDNNLKAIKTRSGHTLLFNDEDGSESITIKDKNGNTINLDTSGKSISISSKSAISISSGNISIKASKNIQIDASENIVMSGKNVVIDAGEVLSATGKTSAEISSGSAKTIHTSKGGDTQLTGTKSTVNGDTMVTVTGATIKLN